MGVGSMGAIYEGVRTETGKRFAIKVLNPALAAMRTVRARFLEEAKLTARVRHPHIIEVADVGEDAGHCYFVMEMLKGEDLARRLHHLGPLSAAESADLLLPVCDAVAEAHGHGITHRDLKPSNIFIAIREGRPHPFVLDFGIAKDGDAPRTLTGAVPVGRAVFGTPYYLSPEQLADHRQAGPASDQYALGVILYECLTGLPPFRGDSVEDVFGAVIAGNPAPPSSHRKQIPKELDAVVLRAMSLDPKARFASVTELAQALRPFASKSTGATPVPYLRTPTSPAIESEASTPSPFVRTLTPELQVTTEAWFAAGEELNQSSGAAAIPSPIEADATSDAVSPSWIESPEVFVPPAKGRGMWMGAAGVIALAGAVVVFVASRGSASPRQSFPAPMEALAQKELPAPSPADQAAAPPVAEAQPAATTPVPTPVQPTEPVASAPPAAAEPAPSEPPAPPAPPAPPVPTASPATTVASAPPAPPVPTAPPVAPVPTEPPAAAVPRELAATAPRAPRAAQASRARKPASGARTRTSAGIRMHNGVPLLD